MEQAIGKRLRQTRRTRDLTQAQLAALTSLNVITISRLENGTAKSVHGDTIVALARALGVSADYLLGLSEREAGGVTDTVTDTTVTDPAHARRMIQEEMRAVIAHAENIIAAIDTAEQRTGTDALETSRVTDTVTDTTPVTDTVTDTAAAPPAKRKAPVRQRAVTDTVTDTETPQPQASNAQRRKRLPVAY